MNTQSVAHRGGQTTKKGLSFGFRSSILPQVTHTSIGERFGGKKSKHRLSELRLTGLAHL